jgi:hypothetical protein
MWTSRNLFEAESVHTLTTLYENDFIIRTNTIFAVSEMAKGYIQYPTVSQFLYRQHRNQQESLA